MKKYTIVISYLIDGIQKKAYFPQDNAKTLGNMAKYEKEIRIIENISAEYADFSINELAIELTADFEEERRTRHARRMKEEEERRAKEKKELADRHSLATFVEELERQRAFVRLSLRSMGFDSKDDIPDGLIDRIICRWDNMTENERTLYQFSEKDSGRFGKAFEINTKMYLNGRRGNSTKVSGKGKTDVRYHGYKLEIKSNCGELNDIEKNSFVVYTMNNRDDYLEPQNARVIPADEFMELLARLNLIRSKVNKSNVNRTIQTYNNSKTRTKALAQAIASYPTLAEWKATV